MTTNRIRRTRFVFLTFFLAVPMLAYAEATCTVRHLTIFDANLAEFLEERTLELQTGLNTVEWRSLMPQAVIGTLRVTADQVSVVRQSVTLDGQEVRGQKSAVLHLALQNSGSLKSAKVRVDYLAPKLSWKSDYSLLLGTPVRGFPQEMFLDGWVSLQNETGTDVCAETVDLVAGDVQLLEGGGSRPPNNTFSAQMSIRPADIAVVEPANPGVELRGVSVFSRLRLGRNISLATNALIDRLPLFQRLKLPVEQRHVFENEAGTQTLGRGGFMLLPRGLEVRLVSQNNTASPLPAGTVMIYSQEENDVPQIVGRDRIQFTAVGADFSVTQGLSNVLQGTRRIVERREAPDTTTPRGRKLVTRVEVVINNRGSDPTTAFVREGIEKFGGAEWTVIESSHESQRLGEQSLEFKLPVPAKGSVKLAYTVEIH